MQDAGCRMQGAGCRMQGAGCRMQVIGCRVQDSGFWTLDDRRNQIADLIFDLRELVLTKEGFVPTKEGFDLRSFSFFCLETKEPKIQETTKLPPTCRPNPRRCFGPTHRSIPHLVAKTVKWKM